MGGGTEVEGAAMMTRMRVEVRIRIGTTTMREGAPRNNALNTSTVAHDRSFMRTTVVGRSRLELMTNTTEVAAGGMEATTKFRKKGGEGGPAAVGGLVWFCTRTRRVLKGGTRMMVDADLTKRPLDAEGTLLISGATTSRKGVLTTTKTEVVRVECVTRTNGGKRLAPEVTRTGTATSERTGTRTDVKRITEEMQTTMRARTTMMQTIELDAMNEGLRTRRRLRGIKRMVGTTRDAGGGRTRTPGLVARRTKGTIVGGATI